MKAGATAGGIRHRSLLKFNFGGVPSDAVIVEAEMSLSVDTRASWGNPADYQVRIPTDTWTSGATWQSPNGTTHRTWSGGGPWGSSVPEGSNEALDTISISRNQSTPATWEVTEALNRWVNAGETNRGFLVMRSSEESVGVLQFRSQSAGSPGLQPTIEVVWEDTDIEPYPSFERAILVGAHNCAVTEGIAPAGSSVTETFGWVADGGEAIPASGSDLGVRGLECYGGSAEDFNDFLGDPNRNTSSTAGRSEVQMDEDIDDAVDEWLNELASGRRTLDPYDHTEVSQESENLASRGAARNPCGSRSRTAVPSYMNRAIWVNTINRRQDISGREFIRNYCHPTHYNWDTDNCSKSGDSSWYFNFVWACRRHDFGYGQLFRGRDALGYRYLWTSTNKAVTDNQFIADMYTNCRGYYGEPYGAYKKCRSRARKYVWFVRNLYDLGMNTNRMRDVHTIR